MIYEKTDNFYIQKIHLINIRKPRFEFFVDRCLGKKVLHIGCADAMVFNTQPNLHVYLSKLKDVAANEKLAAAEFEAAEAVRALNKFEKGKDTQLDGLDIDIETINKLKELCPGKYFTEYKDINEEYDIIIIPEVMEHVPDVSSFLKDVFSIKSKEYLFTVPSMAMAEIFCTDEYALEIIHPDHKYWFSPYTLYNILKPFKNDLKIQMFFLENKTQIGISMYVSSENA